MYTTNGSFLISKKDLKEIYKYKDLLFFLVKRDVSAIYKQTIMGFSWAIIRAFVQMVVFTLVFAKMANLQSDMQTDVPYAVFSFIALVPWTYFSSSLVTSTSSLVSNMSIITKVYFPRLIIPFTPIIAKLVDFMIAFVFVFFVCFYYGIYPKWEILYLPILVLLMMLSSLGFGLWLSAMAIQYRDVNQLMQFGIQVLMYLAPIIWPISYVPESLRTYYALYPLVGIVEGFRACFLEGKLMPFDLILVGYLSSLVVLVSGLIYFRKKESFFADVA